MKMGGVFTAGFFIKPAFGSHVDLTAQDRFDSLLLGLFEKAHSSENIPVVCQGHSRHVVLVGGIDQRRGLQRPIQDAEFRMVVEVYKRQFHLSSHSIHTAWNQDFSIHPRAFSALLPLYGSRRFAGDVVNDPVDSFYLVHDPVRYAG
ncbi:hypothetical protein ES703_89712 [subsurface metagenome]